jgi:hypothetical protein
MIPTSESLSAARKDYVQHRDSLPLSKSENGCFFVSQTVTPVRQMLFTDGSKAYSKLQGYHLLVIITARECMIFVILLR